VSNNCHAEVCSDTFCSVAMYIFAFCDVSGHTPLRSPVRAAFSTLLGQTMEHKLLGHVAMATSSLGTLLKGWHSIVIILMAS